MKTKIFNDNNLKKRQNIWKALFYFSNQMFYLLFKKKVFQYSKDFCLNIIKTKTQIQKKHL